MSHTKINLCHYPTTTLLIDDDADFLAHLALLFASQDFLYSFYSDSSKALHFLNETYKPDPFINRCIRLQEDRDSDRLAIDFDFRKIHHEIYNPNRFREVSVVVVDYAMPAMDGLEFCRQMATDFLRKMILTGEASQRLAIEAFNEGIINKFIQKGIMALPEMLVQGVKELQYQYFYKLSEMALAHTIEMPSCLSDTNFKGLFNYLCESNNIVEYYLLDECGSFLMLDAQAKPHWLIVKSDADMENTYQFAVYQEAPAQILSALKSRRLIPYFHSEKDLKVPLDQCQEYLHPTAELKGNQLYYYAFLTESDFYHIERDKVVSFAEFNAQKS